MVLSPQKFLVFALTTGADARRFLQDKYGAVRVPSADRRKYAHNTLGNGMMHLAVEDKKAAKSGFAVSVSAGSYYDPESLPGLAHFCEHLLFLGTKKYPDPTAFDTYLTQHDGSNNAYTQQESTVFYNEISHAGFDEGMDRFAQFFISPLFKAEMVGRELDAVNSEHMKNIPNQFRKMWELMRGTAKHESVVGHFYTGTTETLHHGDNTTVAALKKYHEENYCAPRMRLITVSNRSIAEQQKIAEQHFSAVSKDGDGKCKPVPRDFAEDLPFSDKANLGRFLHLGTASTPKLWMMFPMQPTLRDYKAQPGSLLTYLLGYAGPHSLKSLLKSEDLINDIGVQVDQSTASTLTFLNFELTPHGASNVGEISNIVFDYLEDLRGMSAAQLKDMYVSLQQMGKVTFDFQEAPDSVMDSVSNLAAAMQNYLPQDVLAGDSVIDNMDVNLIKDLVGHLKRNNVNFALATKDFNEKQANKFNKYYQVHFSDTPIHNSVKTRSSLKEDRFQPPPALRYVPSQLSVSNSTAGAIPQRLADAHGDIWWLGKGRFPLPKAQMRVKLSLPKEMQPSPRLAAMRQLHVSLTNMALEEPLEDLANCGLGLTLKQGSEGYLFSMDGYSEHISAAAALAADGFAKPQLDAKRFQQVRQKVIDSLSDATSKMPYQHAMEALSVMTSSGAFSHNDVVTELKNVTLGDMEAYLQQLSAHGLRVQLLATGNLNQTATQQFANTLVSHLQISTVLKAEESALARVLDAGAGIEVRLPNPIPGDLNSATVNAYQYGTPDVSERVKLLMLSKMISGPAYDELRTKEQLGYIVFATVMPQRETQQMVMIVQGAKKNPDEVDAKIESVMDSFGKSLTNLSSSEFSRWKAAIRSSIAEDDQNMGQEADRLWEHISTGEECFNRRELSLEYLDSFTDAAELAKEFQVFRQKPRKLSIRVFGDHKLVGLPQPTSALQVLQGDNSTQKGEAGHGHAFFAPGGICQIRKQR